MVSHALKQCSLTVAVLLIMVGCPGPASKPVKNPGDTASKAGEHKDRAAARPGGKGRAVKSLTLPKEAMVGDSIQLEGFFEDDMVSDEGTGDGAKAKEPSGTVERAGGKSAGAVKDVYKRVAPATVIVQSARGYGSGIIYHPDGWVLTNHHVIAHHWRDNFRWKVKVAIGHLSKDGIMERDKKVYEAFVHKTDRLLDLAVLKIIDPPKNLQAIAISPQDPTPGDPVTALGHAGIGLVWAIKDGQISAVGKLSTHLAHLMLHSAKKKLPKDPKKMTSRERRKAQYLEKYRKHLQKEKPALVIQSTCDISQGDSGGPLVNRQSELVGLNAFVRSGRIAKKESNFHIHIREIRAFVKDVPKVAPQMLPDPWRDGGKLAKIGDADLDSQVDVMLLHRLVVRRIFFRRYRRLMPTTFFFDLDQDSFKGQRDYPEPKEIVAKRSFESEFIFMANGGHLHAWYDTDNDGKLDILLVATSGYKKAVTEAYRLDAAGKPQKDEKLLKGALVRPALFDDVKLSRRLRKAGKRFFSPKILPRPRNAKPDYPHPTRSAGHAGKLKDYDKDGKPDTIKARGLFSSGYVVDVDQDTLGDFSQQDSLQKVYKNGKVDAEFSLITQKREKWAWYDRDNDGTFDLLLHASTRPYSFVDEAWQVKDGKYEKDASQVGRLLIQPYLVKGLGDRLLKVSKRLIYRGAAKGPGAQSFPDPNDYLGYRKKMRDAGRWKNVAVSGRYGSCTALLVDLDRDTARKAKKAKVTIEELVKKGKFDAEFARVTCRSRVWTFYDTRNKGRFDTVVFGRKSHYRKPAKPVAAYLVDKKGGVALRKKAVACPGMVHPRFFRNGKLRRNMKKMASKLFTTQPDFKCRP